MIEGEDNKAKVAEYLRRSTSSEYDHLLGRADPSSSIVPSPDHLLLGSFIYDPSAASHVQTFPVDPEVVELGIDVGVAIFKIDSNWGGDFTCLYRVCRRAGMRQRRANDRFGSTEKRRRCVQSANLH